MEIVVLFLATIVFLYFMQDKMVKAEKERFREFVLAVKTKDINEYTNVIPEDNEPAEQKQDELTDLSSTDPQILIKALDNENN